MHMCTYPRDHESVDVAIKSDAPPTPPARSHRRALRSVSVTLGPAHSPVIPLPPRNATSDTKNPATGRTGQAPPPRHLPPPAPHIPLRPERIRRRRPPPPRARAPRRQCGRGGRGPALRGHAAPGGLRVDAVRRPGARAEAARGRDLGGGGARGVGGAVRRVQLHVLPGAPAPAAPARPPRAVRLPGAVRAHAEPARHGGSRALGRQPHGGGLHRGRADGAVGGHDQPVHLPGGVRGAVGVGGRARAALHPGPHLPRGPPRVQLARHGPPPPATPPPAPRENHGRGGVRGVRAGAARVPDVGGGGGPEAAAAAAGRQRAGPGGGQGRERQLHDGGGGGGGGAQQQRDAVRDPHQGRGLLRERGGGQREDQHHVRRRRHVEDRHQGQPQRRRQLHHLPLRHASGDRDGVPGAGPDGGERGGAGEAPGGGAAGERGPVGILPLQLRGVPGHALRALAPPVLPRLRRLRHRRLPLRRRRRPAPELQPLRAPPGPRPEERLHGAGPRGPQPEHRHRRAGLQGRRRRRPRPRAGQLLLLPRTALEGLLQDGVHAVQDGEPGAPPGLARVERHLRARHALLRRVHEPGPRRRHFGEGRVARVPRDHHRHRRRQLHRAGVHPGRPLAQLHLLPIHARPRVE